MGMASQKPNEESMSGKREGPAAPTIARSPPEKRQRNALELMWWDHLQLARTCFGEWCPVQE